MSIIKESNGTYTLNYSKKDVITQKVTRTKKRGFQTLKEAKEYERSLSRESSVVTFYSLYKELQDNKEISKNTVYEQDKLIDKHLPALKTERYENLTKPYLLSLRNEINKKDISNRTKNKILGVIKTTCAYANNIYDLPNNSKVLNNFKTEKTEFEVWTVEEYNLFEDAIRDVYPSLVPFFHALFWTGMRKGEARALLVDDLDIDNATISISKSMSKYKKSLKTPKTSSGKRVIKLDKKTLDILKPLKDNEKWLFGDYRPLNLNTIDKVFSYGTVAAGLKKIRIHDLRHSHATFLINNNANIVAVSKRLGHADINMTLSTYTHLLKDTEEKLINIINEM